MYTQCINTSYVKHDIILIRPALFPAQAVSNIFDWTVCVFTLVVVLCCVVLGGVCLRGSECGRGRGWKVPWSASLHVFSSFSDSSTITQQELIRIPLTSQVASDKLDFCLIGGNSSLLFLIDFSVKD